MQFNGKDDVDLNVRLAKKGNKEAFSRLIQYNKISMYRVAVSMLESKEDVEDAIQNSIVKAYEGIIKLKKNEYFKTWLIRILINECRSILKVKKKVIPMENIDESIGVAQDFSNVELINLVNCLQEELRLVTTLFYFEDIPQKKIAKLLDIPEGTVRSRLFRARSKLYEMLKLS